jgi:hypothetical protein
MRASIKNSLPSNEPMRADLCGPLANEPMNEVHALLNREPMRTDPEATLVEIVQPMKNKI